MSSLTIVEGVVVEPKLTGNLIVTNFCNESGVWTNKNCKSISSKWPQVRSEYYRWYLNRMRNDFAMGNVQFVDLPPMHLRTRIRIANSIVQPDSEKPIRYRAFDRCLGLVAEKAMKVGASVHLNKIESDQTDSWPDLLTILKRRLCHNQIPVYLYEPKPKFEGQWFGQNLSARR